MCDKAFTDHFLSHPFNLLTNILSCSTSINVLYFNKIDTACLVKKNSKTIVKNNGTKNCVIKGIKLGKLFVTELLRM